MYYRYVRRGKYVNGPYAYTSIRTGGKVKSVYIGPKMSDVNFSDKVDVEQKYNEYYNPEAFAQQQEEEYEAAKDPIPQNIILDDDTIPTAEQFGKLTRVESQKQKRTSEQVYNDLLERRPAIVSRQERMLESERRKQRNRFAKRTREKPLDWQVEKLSELTDELDSKQYILNKPLNIRGPDIIREIKTKDYLKENVGLYEDAYKKFQEKEILDKEVREKLEDLPEDEREKIINQIPDFHDKIRPGPGMKIYLSKYEYHPEWLGRMKTYDRKISDAESSVRRASEHPRPSIEEIVAETKAEGRFKPVYNENEFSARRSGKTIGDPLTESRPRRGRTLASRTIRLYKQAEHKDAPKLKIRLVGERKYRSLIKQRVPEKQMDEASISNAFYDHTKNEAYVLDEGSEVSKQKAALEELEHASGLGEDQAESRAIRALKKDGVPPKLAESVRGRDEKGEPLAFQKPTKKVKEAIDVVIDEIEESIDEVT